MDIVVLVSTFERTRHALPLLRLARIGRLSQVIALRVPPLLRVRARVVGGVGRGLGGGKGRTKAQAVTV